MNGYRHEMQKLVENFVEQLGDLYQRAVTDALGVRGLNVRGLNGAKSRDNDRNGVNRHSNGRAFGAKRDPEALEALAKTFATFVAKHPGLRIEQINKELGTTTKDLALPIRKMIADGSIKTKGEKRSTTYFAKG